MGVLTGHAAPGTRDAAASLAQVTVTVRTGRPGSYPTLSPGDLRVYEDNQRRPVVSWVAAQVGSKPLDSTILFDGAVKPQVSSQARELADFIEGLPEGTRARVTYASDGGSEVLQDFTTNVRLAAKAFRASVGSAAAGGSIYEAVAHLLKNWRDHGNRRCLFVITDGIDVNDGMEAPDPALNRELQRAIKLAQTAGIPVYTIFARGSRARAMNWSILNYSQSCLSRLSSETGGQAYFEATQTPASFAPYLRQLANDLRHQYVLAFRPLPEHDGGYQSLRVATEIPGVTLAAPTRIFIPKAQ